MKAGVETPRRTGFEGGSRSGEIRAGKSDSEGEMYREKAFRSVCTASGVDARHGSAGRGGGKRNRLRGADGDRPGAGASAEGLRDQPRRLHLHVHAGLRKAGGHADEVQRTGAEVSEPRLRGHAPAGRHADGQTAQPRGDHRCGDAAADLGGPGEAEGYRRLPGRRAAGAAGDPGGRRGRFDGEHRGGLRISGPPPGA